MKRILSAVIALIMIASLLFVSCRDDISESTDTRSMTQAAQAESDNQHTTETEDINMGKEKPEYLVNSLYALQSEKKLKVGYIGGSVTAGTGASSENTTSWRGITTAWLKKYFYRAQITEINAGIGNTGSVFAAYRIDEHLIKHDPNLVFIECAVNDSIDFVGDQRVYGSDQNYVYIETMLQKLYSANKNVDIVFVLTGNFERLKNETDGVEVFGKQYMEIAEYYDIPVIRVGTALAEVIKAENGGVFPEKNGSAYPLAWQKYSKSATDNVHPNDAGYKIYGDTVTAWLNDQLKSGYTAMSTEEKKLPEIKYCDKYQKGELISDACIISPAKLSGGSGDFQVESSGVAATPYTLKSTAAGERISITFNSSIFGLWMVAPSRDESTYITYSIDGGETKQLEVVYGSSRNNKVFILAEGLSAGEHTITIKHNDKNTFDCRYILMAGFDGKPCSVSAQN